MYLLDLNWDIPQIHKIHRILQNIGHRSMHFYWAKTPYNFRVCFHLVLQNTMDDNHQGWIHHLCFLLFLLESPTSHSNMQLLKKINYHSVPQKRDTSFNPCHSKTMRVWKKLFYYKIISYISLILTVKFKIIWPNTELWEAKVQKIPKSESDNFYKSSLFCVKISLFLNSKHRRFQAKSVSF